jgi:hypothetical protein
MNDLERLAILLGVLGIATILTLVALILNHLDMKRQGEYNEKTKT